MAPALKLGRPGPKVTTEMPSGISDRSRTARDRDVSAARLEEAAAGMLRAAMVWALLLCGLLLAGWAEPGRLCLLALAGVTFAAVAATLAATRLVPWRTTASRTLRYLELAATLVAGLIGAGWGCVALLFPAADADHRVLLVAAIGVALASVTRLNADRRVCLAYVAPLCLGAAVAFVLGGTLLSLALAIAVPFVGAGLVLHCGAFEQKALAAHADRLRVRTLNAVVDELLLDFDEDASDWLWRTDETGQFRDIDDGSARGQRPGGLEPFASFAQLLALSDGRSGNGSRAVLTAMAVRKPFRNQLVELRSAEASTWWRLSGKPFFDEGGTFAGYRGVGADMTGARNSESRIAYLANFDTLTGLANRASFHAFAERQCASAAVNGSCHALLCLDLDGFKSVNDGFGHQGGDELLKEVAARLTAVSPDDTFMARLGGDEFAVWLKATTPAKAEALAQKLIAALAVPFPMYDADIEIGTSVGIALTPTHATDVEDLLVKADLALYSAKAAGKGQVCSFAEGLQTSQVARRKLESDLKLALARGEFELHYQPLVDAVDGRVVCCEALIRWKSPDRGYVSPGEFIPGAEAGGLIVPIGRWALHTACREAARWPDDIRVAVNVSPRQMRSADFQQDVTMALKLSGLAPSRLEIEVTEGVFLTKSPTALATLSSLRERGIKIALDDFGTGYSSLNYLIDFPVDKIKIDRSFVSDIETSETARALVDAMLGLARRLSITVVAEGVETKGQALALKRRRCDALQGYLFSRPQPAAEVAEAIAAIPAIFRDAIPTHADSPLALALSRKTAAAR